MKFTEIEFKYNAEGISLQTFFSFAKDTPGVVSYVEASGYDYFYAKKADASCFFRHRVGPGFNQLTFKRKLQDKTNYVRYEYNVHVKMSREEVEAFVKELGFHYNFCFFKSCFIYEYADYNVVYYVVFDKELKEQGRFFEIELKESYPWQNEEAAWARLVELEGIAARYLGVSPQARIKRSLFEIYKEET